MVLGRNILGTDYSLDLHVHIERVDTFAARGVPWQGRSKADAPVPGTRPPQQTLSGPVGQADKHDAMWRPCAISPISSITEQSGSGV